jgi:hypothetical protein
LTDTFVRSRDVKHDEGVDSLFPRNSNEAKKKRTENVDLFAADDRTVIDLISKQRSPAIVTSASVRSELSSISSLLRNSTMGRASRNNFLELQQAEVLKLEAERDLLIMDKKRIFDRKVS